MANTRINQTGTWNNFHSNGPFATKIIFDTANERGISSLIERYNDAGRELQRLIQDSVNNNERLRAYGSAWSLSNIAHQKDRMLFNSRLNIKIVPNPSFHDPLSPYAIENLFFVQCGTVIKEITEFLFKKGKSLKTCGASNGQTIAGSISTGVHGSAIDVGSIQDYVVGLQLITGPNPEDLVFLERHTKPALTEGFAKTMHAKLIRNDDLFNAALVGLGSFGIIHGVLLEAEDLYLLKRYVKNIKREEALAIAETMDFGASAFKIAEEVDQEGRGLKPYHYKLYINPYKANEDFVTEIIYKKPYRHDYDDPVPLIKKAIFKDIPNWIACFAAKHNRFIPKLIGALKSSAFPKLDEELEGTLGEIFWDTTQQSPAFGCALGIAHTDAGRALTLMTELMNTAGPIPGILSMRFSKASEAMLAFTRFEMTCILEVDGILWEGNQNMISLEGYLRLIVETLKSADIPFTLHWGKNGDWGFPGLIDYMYGNLDDQWKDLRSALLGRKMCDIFSNDFLDTVKLSDYRASVSPDIIASR